MLCSMAYTTQYLYVCRVCTNGWCTAVRFFMMPLQIGCGCTLLALPTLSDNMRNSFSTCVRPFARTAVPVRVRFFAHSASTSRRHTVDRAVLPGASTTLANLKLLSALFARTLKQCFLFACTEFLRACDGARVGGPTYVRVWACEQRPAGTARKGCMPATFNSSLEFSHG